MKWWSGNSATDEICGYKIKPGVFASNGAFPVAEGVNFTIHSRGATACTLVLFHNEETTPYVKIPFPDNCRIGDKYAMIVFGLDITQFEYCYQFDGEYNPKKGLLFSKDNYILDPYAKAVTGQRQWGERPHENDFYRARVVDDNYDWGNFKQPEIPLEDLVIYEMHVRGFTQDSSSRVKNPGTFAGIREKIPYLKKLGVNAIELMPIFEFDEMEDDRRNNDGKRLYNYWGYNTVCFFAPNTSYSSHDSHNKEGLELKKLIRQLNSNGIEVILDVVFNHTAEGNENGRIFSFKGIDNNIYYMLTPDGFYYNFSGCGNAMNCNHPIVRQLIWECLRYWVTEYRVDGFRFDLASILGRDENGAPMEKPPLIETLAFDPILGSTKLIAEAWDAGGLYQVGSFPHFKRWAEWNGKYRDDIRCFLKGDNEKAGAAIDRITGSLSMYHPESRGKDASVNFLNCHDGFTLYDMYAYNSKHNEANGWDNTDGANDNYSWNCGIEGETTDENVNKLRQRMCRNAFATLLCSRGAAMFYAGDEFCNTQFGNNNAYCQDNEISWLDWNRVSQFEENLEFTKLMIAFRTAHPVVRKRLPNAACGYPDISIHNDCPWNEYYKNDTHVIGIMFAGRPDGWEKDDVVYLAINSFWEPVKITMPDAPEGYRWKVEAYTDSNYDSIFKRFSCHEIEEGRFFWMKERSVMVASAERIANE